MKTTTLGVVMLLSGFIFFLGFFFAEVNPRIETKDQTTMERCQIMDVRNITRACAKISCNLCGCSNIGCEQLISQNRSGDCCHGVCCEKSACISYSSIRCNAAWGSCWNMTVLFEIQINGENTERVYHRECTFNDLGCVHKFYEEFPSDSVKTCWHDPKDRVLWSSPNGPGNWWIGAGFGLGFMALGGLLYILAHPDNPYHILTNDWSKRTPRVQVRPVYAPVIK